MDLTNAIVGLQQAKIASQVQVQVAKKMLDVQEQQGVAAIKLLQAASQSVMKAGDQLAASATGLGALCDVKA